MTHRGPLTGVLLLLVLGPVLFAKEDMVLGQDMVLGPVLVAKEELLLPLPLQPLWPPSNAPQAYRAPFQLYVCKSAQTRPYVRTYHFSQC